MGGRGANLRAWRGEGAPWALAIGAAGSPRESNMSDCMRWTNLVTASQRSFPNGRLLAQARAH
eukprot:503553-Alexandrium_andersonii.AAC.1